MDDVFKSMLEGNRVKIGEVDGTFKPSEMSDGTKVLNWSPEQETHCAKRYKWAVFGDVLFLTHHGNGQSPTFTFCAADIVLLEEVSANEA